MTRTLPDIVTSGFGNGAGVVSTQQHSPLPCRRPRNGGSPNRLWAIRQRQNQALEYRLGSDFIVGTFPQRDADISLLTRE